MQDENPNHRVLKTGNYAGLKFEQGWFFVHVLETEYIELKPWILLNENNERGEIGAQTAGSTDDEIVDEVDRRLLTPRQSEQNMLFQLFVGVAPSRMQIYPRFGRDSTPNLVGGAGPGSPQVPLTGFDSPYNNPSQQGEVITVNGMESLALQAYNPMDEPAEARLSFGVNKMKYVVIDDENVMLSFLQGQRPFREHPVGLGAQDRDQMKAPGWLMDKFGDAVLSTQEIFERADTETANEDIGSQFPRPNME